MASTKELEHKIELLEKRKFELQKFIQDLAILIDEFVSSSNYEDISNKPTDTSD